MRPLRSSPSVHRMTGESVQLTLLTSSYSSDHLFILTPLIRRQSDRCERFLNSADAKAAHDQLRPNSTLGRVSWADFASHGWLDGVKLVYPVRYSGHAWGDTREDACKPILTWKPSDAPLALPAIHPKTTDYRTARSGDVVAHFGGRRNADCDGHCDSDRHTHCDSR
jgi:hypothetical protein